MKNKLDEMIKSAMLEKNSVKLTVLRNIKTAFMNYETAKGAKPLDEQAEFQILKKMLSQQTDAYNQFLQGGRSDIAEKEKAEIEIIKTFLPPEVSREEVVACVESVISTMHQMPTLKEMGVVIKAIKEALPTADGKVISDLVREKLQ